MGSPVIFGANQTTTGLQNAFLMANGINNKYDGPKNYITYGNFENNLTTGWSLGTIGTLTNGLPTGTPTFGSGASANLSITTVSSGQLAGTYSLSLVSSAVTVQGNMLASQAYTLDNADQAKVLQFKFNYSTPTNPSNVNFSGTSSNSWAVAVWDVTNSVWLGVAGAFNIVQSTGVGVATGTFQTGATTASIRFIIYAANATAGASTMYLDSIFVGPQPTAIAPAMGDWQAYTPGTNGLGTVSNVFFLWRRVGDSVQINGTLTTGTVAAAEARVNLPSGLTIDTTKILSARIVGVAGEVGQNVTFAVLASAAANNYVQFSSFSGTTITTPANGNALFGSSNTLTLNALIPITGWSSNAVSSADTATNVVASRYGLTSNLTGLAPNSTAVKITFADASTAPFFDLTGSCSSGKYTAPVTGTYEISSSIIVISTNVLNNTYQARLYINGAYSSVLQQNIPPATSQFTLTGSTQVKLNAGDYVEIYLFGSGNNSVNTLTVYGATPDGSSFSVKRLSGPAVVQATDTVAAGYVGNATNSIANNTITWIDFQSKSYDTTNSVTGAGNGPTTTAGTGWKFVCPVGGKYRISANLVFTAFAVAGEIQILFYKNTTALTQNIYVTTATSHNWSMYGGYTVSCNAGDTLQVACYQTSGVTQTLIGTNQNNVSIERVGN